MKNLLLLFVAFCCFVFTLSRKISDPPRPKIPETFESTGELHIIESNGTIVGVGRWAIDQPHGKGVRHFEFGNNHAHKNILEVLRYDLKLEFTVTQDKCVNTTVAPPMPVVWQWLKNATYNGTVTEHNKTLDSWIYTYKQISRTLFVAQNLPNVPVIYEEKHEGVGSVQVHFWAFQTHQPNPDWFDIPQQCIPHSIQKLSKTHSTPVHHEEEVDVISDAEAQIIIEKLSKAANLSLPTDICTKAASCASQICGQCHCPYVYGGETNCCSGSHGGLDCSGLVQYSYVHCGGWSGMPRTTFQMWDELKTDCGACSPTNTGACHVGDLFFYYPSSSGPDHVIMYIGNGLAAECPHTGADCRILRPYSSPYVGCRRLC